MDWATAIGWRVACLMAVVWGSALAGCAGSELGAVDGVVTGRLVTEIGRYPVAGARVRISGMETTTSSAGVFRINNVAIGTHRLEVTAEGHVLLEDFAHVQVLAGTNDLGDIELIAESDMPGPVPPPPPPL